VCSTGIRTIRHESSKNTIFNGHEVIAVDIDESVVAAIANEVTYAVQADATDEQACATLE